MNARFLLALVVVSLSNAVFAVDKPDEKPKPDADGFYSLFDGKTLNGWKATENPNMAKVEDGAIVISKTDRSHLFYDGPVNNHDFKNFEFKAKCKAIGDTNSGIYFHVKFQEKDYPNTGFEAQIYNAKEGTPRKTGSLYELKDTKPSLVEGDEWFDYDIIVKGKTITLKVNGKTTAEWTQPEKYKPAKKTPGRFIDHGTFALQGHHPKNIVYFKDIKIKPLAD